MAPVIGVMPLYDDEKESIWMLPGYMDAVTEAGGIPIMLPLRFGGGDAAKLDELCDGYVFTGGHDIDPGIYGEEKLLECGMTNSDRDKMEKLFFEMARKEDKPVLGICRGLQMINALMGGSLYQDLPSERPSMTEHHMKPPYDRKAHGVRVIKSSSLYGICGREELPVNSYHHQAIKDLAPGLSAMAVSDDGLIEAAEDRSRRFLMAVQWHPEFLYERDECSIKLFRAFVDAAAEYEAEKRK